MEKKVCVYAICKNESEFVKRWVDSMSEADYIVVLDTGSSDDTVEKLLNDPRVTRVEQKVIKPWRFDVARNESMKLVPDDADILICTDFDEWFEPGWCTALKQIWTPGVTRAHYSYAWSHNDLGEPTDVFVYDKAHTRDYQWIYPVHEVLWPINKEFKEVYAEELDKIYLHHFQDKTKSRGNYLPLLKLSVKENPDDSHTRMLLAREYLVNKDFSKALNEYLKVLEMPDVNDPLRVLVKLESLGRVADLYFDNKDYKNALEYCQQFILIDKTYREPYLIMANIYNSRGLYTLAESTLKAMVEYSTRKFSWVERANSWIADYNDALSVAEFNLGKIDQAIENGKIAYKHNPNDIRITKNLLHYYMKKYDSVNN